MQTLVEDFLQYLSHERGLADNTTRTYAALLGKFVAWAETQKLTGWSQVELKHLMAFLQYERARPLADEPKSAKRLSSESVYLEIAALRAFYKFAENEKMLPLNVAENLSLPRRWQRLPKALSNAGNGNAAASPKRPPRAGKLVRPGHSGAGLRLRPAAVGIEKSPAGTIASGGRLHQRHWQGQQGAHCAGGTPGRGGIEPVFGFRAAQADHAQVAGECVFYPGAARRLPP